jgi:hypothetical protein
MKNQTTPVWTLMAKPQCIGEFNQTINCREFKSTIDLMRIPKLGPSHLRIWAHYTSKTCILSPCLGSSSLKGKEKNQRTWSVGVLGGHIWQHFEHNSLWDLFFSSIGCCVHPLQIHIQCTHPTTFLSSSYTLPPHSNLSSKSNCTIIYCT